MMRYRAYAALVLELTVLDKNANFAGKIIDQQRKTGADGCIVWIVYEDGWH